MAFSFDYRGVISCASILGSSVESLHGTFMKRACAQFERANADVEIYGSEMHFRVSSSRLPIFSIYPPLIACSGKIILHPEEGMITYHLSFTDGIIITSVLIWGIFGSFFLFVVNGPLPVRLAIVVVVWLVMIMAARLSAISRFKQFINTLVSE